MDFELLLKQFQATGDWLGTVYAVLYITFGILFIPLIWLLLMIPIYIKTRSVIVVAVLTLLFTSLVIAVLPAELHQIAYVMIVVSIATVLARVFMRW